MSLNWDLTHIKNYKEVCWMPKDENGLTELNPVTNALIWTTMSVDIGRITEQNADEFYARCTIIERLFGAPLYRRTEEDERESYGFTPEDVRNHIGLSCNVNTLTRAKWLTKVKGIVTRMTDEAKYEYKRQLEPKPESPVSA